MRFVAEHLELFVTGLCLAVVIAVPALFGPERFWQAAAVTAVVVIAGHGVFFWAMRRRQQRRDARFIAGVRAMLKDRVNNQLQVVVDTVARSARGRSGSATPPIAQQLADVLAATRVVSRTLDELSLEGYHHWRTRYEDLSDYSQAAMARAD
jgi:hypothetical protein